MKTFKMYNNTSYSAAEAKAKNIFVIENDEVVQTNLYDFVMESAEETTSPRGVENKLHIDEAEVDANYEIGEEEIIDTVTEYRLMEWQANGKALHLAAFEKESEAQDALFTAIYKCDFLPDDQRDTFYAFTKEEAEAELVNRID
jgi:hypothetical protein